MSPIAWLILAAVLVVAIGGIVATVLVVMGAKRRRPKDNPRGNLTPCPDCGRMLSPLAPACPQCRPVVLDADKRVDRKPKP